MSSSQHHQSQSQTSAIPTGQQKNSTSHSHHHHHHNLQPVTGSAINNDERENHSIVSGGGGSGRTKNATSGNSREGGSNSNRDYKERKRTVINVIIRMRSYRAMSRAIGLSRAFFTWKTKVSLMPFLIDHISNMGIEGDEKGGEKSDSKANSYLTLFFENERLRQQLKEQQRNSKAARQHAGAASLACLLRSRRRMLCRAFLDRWIQMSNMEAHRSSHIQQATELKIGLQKLESERALIQQLQSRSQKLSLALALGSYYSRWKARTVELKMRAERRAQQQQLAAIHEALVRVRATSQLTNQRESEAWHGALQTGRDLEGNLQAMMGQMHTVTTLLQKQGSDLPSHLHSGDSSNNLNQYSTGGAFVNLISPPATQNGGRQNRSSSPKL